MMIGLKIPIYSCMMIGFNSGSDTKKIQSYQIHIRSNPHIFGVQAIVGTHTKMGCNERICHAFQPLEKPTRMPYAVCRKKPFAEPLQLYPRVAMVSR